MAYWERERERENIVDQGMAERHAYLCSGDVNHGQLIEREGEDVFIMFEVRFILQSLSQTLCIARVENTI